MENCLCNSTKEVPMFFGRSFQYCELCLLCMMMAQVCGLEVGDYVHTFGDVHIYNNHFEQVNLQLSREPRDLPTMKLNPEIKDLFEFNFEDFTLENYNPYPGIKAPVAV
jgi:thymidylate synthase